MMKPDLPASMRCVAFRGAGGPEVIVVEGAPLPVAGPGQVLVKVAAAGINRPDCLQRAGLYPPPPGAGDRPGLEIAGSVVGLGAGVSSLRLGEKVCALTIAGGYAEYAIAEAELCLPIPAPLTLVEAAALPETAFTVYDNIFTRGGLRKGESLLVHGGSSGIGSLAIQVAKTAGATVYTTAGSAEKCAFCESLGADAAIDYRKQDFVARIAELTGKRGVDVILDMVGGDYIARNLRCLALDGRLVQIAFLKSSVAELDLRFLMVKRQTITGSTLRPRSVAQKAAIAQKLRQEIWPLLDSGAVRPILYKTFPLEQAHAAHELMETSAHLGKIVLTADSD
jgi:NADPH:quinone reductase